MASNLIDLYNIGRPELDGGWSQSPELVDRMSMLPIGQYEDGSLTLAWPGMIKDMYEGAVRSYEQGRQLPRVDEQGNYAGTPRAEPLDAFNAASIAPMAGVAGRVTGSIPRGALGSGGSDMLAMVAEQPAPVRAFHGTFNDIQGDFRPSGLGPHFGTSDQASNILDIKRRAGVTGDHDGSIFPVDITTSNAFEGNDLQHYYPQFLIRDLRDTTSVPKNVVAEVDRLVAGGQTDEAFDVVRRAYTDAGYDAYRYRNRIEGDGWSYVPLQPGTVRSATTGETLFANDSRSALPAIGVNAVEQPAGIRAYHGSPHEFDRFDASHIGEGEGAQAFGYGLYFGEKEGVAQSYRGPTVGDWGQVGSMPEGVAADYLGAYGEHAVRRLASDPSVPDGVRQQALELLGKGHSADQLLALAQRKLEDAGRLSQGRTYEVNINAHPEQFIDFDKPFSHQNPAIREALGPIYGGDDAGFQAFLQSPEAAGMLGEAGVPGIRYLDGMSREAGEGTSNYVVFPGNEHLIDIMRKYANPETAATPSLLLQGQEGDTSGLMQFANADPAYDADALVREQWQGLPFVQGDPSAYNAGHADPFQIQQQMMLDPLEHWFRPQPSDPPPLFR